MGKTQIHPKLIGIVCEPRTQADPRLRRQARGRLNMQPPGLGLEVYAGFRPGQSQAFLARFRTWMDTHTDQVIIVGSLLLGFWLIAKSIYLIIT